MEPDLKPDPRFQNFNEVFNAQGNPIGFQLPGNNFLFKYEEDGGWYDQKGNYYNSEGILQQQAHSDRSNSYDDQDDNLDQQEILDQFQQMLAEEQQGIVHKKSAVKQTQQQPKKQKPVQKINYIKQSQSLLTNLKEEKLIRNSLSKDLIIFFKIRTKFFTKIEKLEVQKQNSIQNQNAKVKQIQKNIEQQRKKLITANKWLQGENVYFDFSGSSLQDNLYERYWHGRVKATPQSFLNIWHQIKKSQQFSVLQHKAYFSLKSKFYAKQKMQKFIEEMKEKVEKFNENEIAQIVMGNLPEQFPISFVFDLLDFVGVSYSDVIQIVILNDFDAKLKVTKTAAILITNLQGYCHDQGEYVQIEIKSAKKQVVQRKNWFKIELDASFKFNFAELYDTMAFQQSKEGVLKHLNKEQKYRWIIGQKCLKRAVMFRGPTVNIESICQVCTQKDII